MWIPYAIGKGVQFGGSVWQGEEQSKSYVEQAQAKETQALEVRQRGLWTEERANEQSRRILSTQRQLYGQAGVTLEGTPSDVMLATNQQMALDRLQLATNTRQQAEALYQQADQLRSAARNAKIAGWINAWSGALGGSSQFMAGGQFAGQGGS